MTAPQPLPTTALDHLEQPMHIIHYHDAKTRRSCDQLGICQYAHVDCTQVCARLAEDATADAVAPPPQRGQRAKRASDTGLFWLSSPAELAALAGPDEARYLSLSQTGCLLVCLLGFVTLTLVAPGFAWVHLDDVIVQFLRHYAAITGLG